MKKLLASIIKDFRLLFRDKVGLILMFAMPILLVLVITSLQNNTFKIVNDHQVPLVFFNQDGEEVSLELEKTLREVGMFDLIVDTKATSVSEISTTVAKHDALVGLYLPKGFSEGVTQNAEYLTGKAMSDLGVNGNELQMDENNLSGLDVYYSPVLQESYRMAVEGALKSSLKVIQSRKKIGRAHV